MVDYKTQTTQNESGFALIMALVISSVVLSIGLSMLSITIKQIDLSSSARESEVAFQVASAALDCALMTRINEEAAVVASPPLPDITFDCGDITQSVSPSGNNIRKYILAEDWTSPSGQQRYMKIEMIVVNAMNEDRSYNPPGRNFSRTCADGNYCTYIFAQGYNRSESEVTSGASFTVQRELTAEF